MSVSRQLKALLQKDIVIRKFKRHYFWAVLEFVFPLLIWKTALDLWSYTDIFFSEDEWDGPAKKYEPLGPFGAKDITRNWGLIVKILFMPKSDYAKNITNNIFNSGQFSVEGFDTEYELENATSAASESAAYYQVLVLRFLSGEHENKLSYTMRWKKTRETEMRTETIFPESSRPRYFDKAEEEYLWPVMCAIFVEHLKFFDLDSVETPRLQPLPTPAYHGTAVEPLFGYLATLISGFIFGTFIIFLSSYSKNIMQDKETRLRELLRMMGLTDRVYWTNAFLVGLLNALPLCMLSTIALCVRFHSTAILKADYLLIFIVILCYAIGLIFLALLVSVLVKSAKLGSIIVLLAQTAGFIVTSILDPSDSTSYAYLPASIKLATCMYSPCGIYWAFKLIGSWERRGIGANWLNLCDAAIEGDNITLGGVLLTMISSWFLWMAVILYLDAIIPWQYGMPKHPLFFARYSYWFPVEVAADKMELVDLVSADADLLEATDGANVVVRLNRITHEFGAIRALNDLSLELYANQITVLLGHNGAGKTTAMNILTGLFPPTRGDIFINGFDVRKNTKKAREGVGLCPQHNVLFDDLTVEEHLMFFAKLKSSNAVNSEVEDLMSKFELTERRAFPSTALSGGMKRKLSLANAMVGGSSILILDEPSSGLDPEARRVVWDLLQQERTRRTVLMTTHYMEEADVLGDRIAFLAAGKLMCAGSPMFLKRKFETGYKLRVTKIDRSLNPEPIIETIRSLLPENADSIHLVSDMSYETVVNVGFPSSADMITMFKHLEDNQQQLGIESLGTSVTTMEDVFLKVGQHVEELARKNKDEQTPVNVFESFPKFQRLAGLSLVARQISAILVMRFHSLRRDQKIIGFMAFLPLAFSLLLAVILIPGDGITRSKPITYDINKILRSPRGFIAGDAEDPAAEAFRARLEKAEVRVSRLPEATSKEGLDDYFTEQAESDPVLYKLHSYAGMLKGSNSIYFNGQPYHIGAAALADWQAARLTELTRKQSQVTITNHPLDEKSEGFPAQSKVEGMRFLTVLLMGVIFSCVSCALIITPIQERVRKSKLIQIMSGVNSAVYIGSNFIFDGILMLICLIFCLVIMLCVNPMGGFTTMDATIPLSLLIFVLFVFASTPWVHVCSYLFNSPTTGFSIFLATNVVILFVADLVFSVIEIFRDAVRDGADFHLYILSLVPVFSASWSFTTTLRNGCAKAVLDALGAEKLCATHPMSPGLKVFCNYSPGSGLRRDEYSVFNMNRFTGIGCQLIAMVATGVTGLVLSVLVEMNSRRLAHLADSFSIRKLTKLNDPTRDEVAAGFPENPAVEAERQTVLDILKNGQIESHSLVTKNATKYFGAFRAVNHISFHVKKNECFGLLGVNGAGKTTTFSMLTGDCVMSHGNSFIQDTDVRSRLQAYQEHIGYCPQFDALVDTLTGREMLSLFCGLRGVPKEKVSIMIDFMTAMADLEPHIDKLTKSYSGGNKRKLSLAIAMIGNPQLLFLDEPSAGVDPGARRKIWATLVQAQKELNSSVVLTSHSMDECEALCHRLVIMLRGSFRCLGSSQQIKSRYGMGFTVSIKLKTAEQEHQAAVQDAMHCLFEGNCELKESYQCLLQFHVNDSRLRWSEVFERIEKLRKRPQLQIEDMQVSDTTLEQVFLNFARENAPEDTPRSGVTQDRVAV